MNDLAINSKPLTALDIQHHVNTIKEVMDQVMKPDVHYGIIPGCKEPSLYKAGAEKIMATFRLAPKIEVIDLSDDDQVRYRVIVNLYSPTGIFVGSGIGECSSNEEKYKWRAAVNKQEFEEAPANRKREKWKKGYKNNADYKVQQIRTEPADLANTILKMAKKRGFVDATLTCTAASDCFTQDVEDLPPEYFEATGEQPQAKGKSVYPQESFDKNFPEWEKAVSEGKSTPERIVAMLSSKGQLTEEQKKQILNIKKPETTHENS